MTPELQAHLKQYREAEKALFDHIDATFPYGSLVRVDFHGRVLFGKSLGPSNGGADHLQVDLERAEHHYALECVRPITDKERNNLPKWLR